MDSQELWLDVADLPAHVTQIQTAPKFHQLSSLKNGVMISVRAADGVHREEYTGRSREGKPAEKRTRWFVSDAAHPEVKYLIPDGIAKKVVLALAHCRAQTPPAVGIRYKIGHDPKGRVQLLSTRPAK